MQRRPCRETPCRALSDGTHALRSRRSRSGSCKTPSRRTDTACVFRTASIAPRWEWPAPDLRPARQAAGVSQPREAARGSRGGVSSLFRIRHHDALGVGAVRAPKAQLDADLIAPLVEDGHDAACGVLGDPPGLADVNLSALGQVKPPDADLALSVRICAELEKKELDRLEFAAILRPSFHVGNRDLVRLGCRVLTQVEEGRDAHDEHYEHKGAATTGAA